MLFLCCFQKALYPPSIFIELITTSNVVTLKNNNGSTSQYRRYLSVYNQSKKCKIVN